MNSKRKNILIASIAIVLITLMGSTYAFFMYSKSSKAFVLTSNNISAEFLSGDNTINLTYAYPISDSYAKDNLNKLGYIDFTVKGNSSAPKELVTYEIYLEEDSNNNLDSSYIKVYLTDDTNKEIKAPRSYNDLTKTTYPNSTNGKVIYQASESNTFEDKYRIYVWLDDSYTQNTTQETFSFKVNLYAYNDTESAVSLIKSKLVKYEEANKDTFSGGLVAVNTDGELYNETNPSEEIREYRYSGPNVDNYVTFNDEVWRIVGVFKDENNDEHLKIVRNNVLTRDMFPATYSKNGTEYNIQSDSEDRAYWNKKVSGINNNDWATAGLQYWLNDGEDVETKSSNDGYMSYLGQNSKDMLEGAEYYLGIVTNYNQDMNGGTNELRGIKDTARESYKYERAVTGCEGGKGPSENNSMVKVQDNATCRVWANNQATWIGKVSLLYPSDFGYSADNSYWNNTILGTGTFNKEAFVTSWLNSANHSNGEWILSPSSLYNLIAYWTPHGTLHSDHALGKNSIRPCLYLKSNVKIASGDGSATSPYSLKLGN